MKLNIDIAAPNAPQRVLLLGSYAPSLINFRGPLIAAIVSAGHEVHVGAPDIDPHTAKSLRTLGAHVHEIEMERQGTGLTADLSYFRTLIRLMKKIGPDLVVTYTIKPNIWGAFAAAYTGAQSAAIVTGLGFAFTEIAEGKMPASALRRFKKSLVQRIARWLYAASAKRNAQLIFQNPDDRDDFIAAGCLADTGKVRMVNGSGVDLSKFQPVLLPDKPSFLMISRILGAKGVREYARAAIEVKHTHPAAQFRLVGFFDKGPDAISTSELDCWVAQGLEYLGPSDDVRSHLANARIYVLPSYREGTPRSVLEAMATGRAILTSDAPGCRETVEEGINGFLVRPRDHKHLAEKMRWMIDNPKSCVSMAQESLRIVKEKYDVDCVNQVMLQHLGLV